jgi:FdhE protein
MPPLSRTLFEPDDVLDVTIDRLMTRLAHAELPPQTAAAVQTIAGAPADERRAMAIAALKDASPAGDLAVRALIAAALQIHFARLAAMLEAGDLKPVAEGICPCCGSPPIASAVVGWPKAHNTRFCACYLCATMWNEVRVKCLLCGSTDGISFRAIEGKPDTIKAETCDKCRSYVKVLYQVKDPVLEPLSDDVASLGLDMLLAEEGWKRGGHNPFVHGY